MKLFPHLMFISLFFFKCSETSSVVHELREKGIDVSKDIKIVALVSPHGCQECMSQVVNFLKVDSFDYSVKVIFTNYSNKKVKMDFDIDPSVSSVHIIGNSMYELKKGSHNPYIFLLDNHKVVKEFEISPNQLSVQLLQLTNSLI